MICSSALIQQVCHIDCHSITPKNTELSNVHTINSVILGSIFIKPTATLDYETESSYTLKVTTSDGEFEDVKNLTIYVDDINEEPFFTAVKKLGDVLESETTSRVVIDMDASDPDGDVLNFKITGSNPSVAPFTIDNGNGEFNSLLHSVMTSECQ